MEPIENEWKRITRAEKDGSLSFVPAAESAPTRVAVLPDLHVPYHDPVLLDRALEVAQGADHIVIIGDMIDAYTVSDFSKDPDRKHSLQDELDEAVAILRRIRAENPDARIDFIEGNHCERIRRYILNRAPAFAGMRELELPRLLQLDELGINHHPRSGFRMYGFRFKHGDLVRSKSGYTARAEMDAHRCNGISGHTHRLGRAVVTDREGFTTEWHEAGHLCDVRKAEYVASPDWQAGMLTLCITNDGVDVTPVEF